MGIPIPRRKRTTGASRAVNHGEERRPLGHTDSAHGHPAVCSPATSAAASSAAPEGATNQRPAPTHEAATPPRRQTQGQQQFSPGSPSKPRTGATAETLRDGKTLCPDFNNNKCDRKGPSCDKGLHKCAKILRGGRPCGMSYHGAYNCRNV